MQRTSHSQTNRFCLRIIATDPQIGRIISEHYTDTLEVGYFEYERVAHEPHMVVLFDEHAKKVLCGNTLFQHFALNRGVL